MKRLVTLIMMLAGLSAQAGTLEDLQAEGVIKLYHDYRSGHGDDLSNNNNDSSFVDAQWTNSGVRLPQTSSVIDVADSAELQLTEGTLIIFSDFLSQTSSETFIRKRDGGGRNYEWYISATQMVFADGTYARIINTTAISGKKCAAINFKDGEVAEAYLDGVFLSTFSGVSAVSVNDAPLTIGNWLGAPSPIKSTLYGAMIINRKLTATEQAAICGELQAIQYPTSVTSRAQGSYGVELIVNGDFETGSPPTGWGVGNGATLTSQTGNVLGGSQIIRIARDGDYGAATQSLMPDSSNKDIRVTGWARGDGTSPPQVFHVGSRWPGTNSTSWQYFDIIYNASNNFFQLRKGGIAGGGTYVEFDNISVTEVETNRTDWKTDWGAIADGVTYAAGAFVGPFEIQSGTWRVVTDTIDGTTVKVLECITAGSVSVSTTEFHQDNEQNATGTWEWFMSVPDAVYLNFGFIASTEDPLGTAGQQGYSLSFSPTQEVEFREWNGAAVIQPNRSAASYFSHSTWYKLKTTVDDDREFTFYLDDTLIDFSGGAGSNPVTETTYDISNNIVISTSDGSKISLSSLKSDYSISKMQGLN